jgi:hypothetical protein
LDAFTLHTRYNPELLHLAISAISNPVKLDTIGSVISIRIARCGDQDKSLSKGSGLTISTDSRANTRRYAALYGYGVFPRAY